MRSALKRSLNRNPHRRPRSFRPRLKHLEERSCPSNLFPQYTLVEPPQGGGYFGAQVLPLSTGNIVVTASSGDAVFLYNGTTAR